MAPRATGVPSRNDSTSSCITLVSRVWDSANASTTTRGTNSTVETRRAPLANRAERRSKNVATAARRNTTPMAVTVTGGSTMSLAGSGGGSNERPRSMGSRFPAT